jgi:hypothetical protein
MVAFSSLCVGDDKRVGLVELPLNPFGVREADLSDDGELFVGGRVHEAVEVLRPGVQFVASPVDLAQDRLANVDIACLKQHGADSRLPEPQARRPVGARLALGRHQTTVSTSITRALRARSRPRRPPQPKDGPRTSSLRGAGAALCKAAPPGGTANGQTSAASTVMGWSG